MRQKADICNSNPETLPIAQHPPSQRASKGPTAGALLSRVLRSSAPAGLLLGLVFCFSLTGCFGFLKPVHSSARRFVLTSLSASDPGSAPSDPLSVGVGQVKVPAYLFNSSLAIRKGTNEIVYSTSVLWAEHLDNGIQRVLAANLATLLHTDQVRLSAWRREDISAEVYVAVEQFDVDAGGKAALVAWWRVLAPGGEKTLKAGTSRLERQGPSPDTDPSGSVGTLSGLLAEFSGQLAQTVNGTHTRK